MPEPIIQVENLGKSFKGKVQAVDGVSFNVIEGEFFAFLGPNGAGKSTTIQMLTTLLQPTSGQAKIAGYDVLTEPEKIRKIIGVALQETGIDPKLTGRELLDLQGRLFGYRKDESKKRTQELLELVGLVEDSNRPCGNYSGGMRRRLDLALTLVQKPKILFLDEPTTGLDPYNRKLIWEEIRSLNKNGTTIFLTTQYLEEADQLADRIAIINEGQIVATGTQKELKKAVGKDVIEFVFKSEEETSQAAETLAVDYPEQKQSGTELRIFDENGTFVLPDLIRRLDQLNLYATHLNVSPPTLDDVFLQMTAKSFKKNEIQEG